MMRRTWIDKAGALALTRQCVLAGVSRAAHYAWQKPKLAVDGDVHLMRQMDEEYRPHTNVRR